MIESAETITQTLQNDLDTIYIIRNECTCDFNFESLYPIIPAYFW